MAVVLIGGGLGVELAGMLLRVMVVLLPEFSIPTEADIRLNVPVLLFSMAATIMAGVVCGWAPAWEASRRKLYDTPREGWGSGGARRRGLSRGMSAPSLRHPSTVPS